MSGKPVMFVLIGGAMVTAIWLVESGTLQPIENLQETVELTSPEALPFDPEKVSHVPNEFSEAATEAETQKVAAPASQIVDDTGNASKWPDEIENLILDYLSGLDGFKFTSIKSIQCDEHTCENLFSGLDPNPMNVDDADVVIDGMFLPPINAQTGMVGTQVVAAGARELVIRISNAPYVESTLDR